MIDETDKCILRTLQRNAKLTTKELASEVNLSASPVFERQKRLEREGYIKRYVAVVDGKKVGNGMIVLCNIRLKQQNKQYGTELVDAITQMEEVTECYNTSGEFDYMMKLYVRDMPHYQNFILNTLGVLNCVGSIHSIFVIGEEKCSYAVPVL